MDSELKHYKTINEIRKDFADKLLSPKQAIEILAKKETQKAWHSRDWRAIREELIKTECEQCHTSEPPMVLQHMWHPDKLSHLIRDVAQKYRYDYVTTNPVPKVTPPPPEDIRKGCPGCGKFSGFNWRKTMNNWRCVHCATVFDELVDIPVLSPRQYEKYYTEYKAVESAWEEKFMQTMEDVILREALQIGFEQHERYISCKDIVTFCRKCAFMWDKNNRKICEGCGKWTPVYTTPDSCFTCLDKIYGFNPQY